MDWLEYENKAYELGFDVICGVDEAGRGPLAGPVYAAAVILPRGYIVDGVNDSKKLSEKKRDLLFDKIVDECVCYSVGTASVEEIDKINKYVTSEVPKLINDYRNIVVDNKIVGCLLLTNKDDGKLLDEIYLEEEYRDKGIGTKIIKNILNNNDIVYLWVYKENKKAISLYKKLGFCAIEETESRYYMKYSKGVNSTK